MLQKKILNLSVKLLSLVFLEKGEQFTKPLSMIGNLDLREYQNVPKI